MEEKKKLYVLISKDLQPVYGCVQGGHAVAKYLLDNPKQTWNNSYIYYVYADIDKWVDKLTMLGETFSVFEEIDLDFKQTALAIEHSGNLFKKLKLVA